MHKSEINLDAEYLRKYMAYHLKQAAIDDEIWLSTYRVRMQDSKDPLYKLLKEYYYKDYFNYAYSLKVQHLSCLLGNYCMEELFSFLIEIKKYSILRALEILGILPKWYRSRLKDLTLDGKSLWPQKDSKSCYKHIIKNN